MRHYLKPLLIIAFSVCAVLGVAQSRAYGKITVTGLSDNTELHEYILKIIKQREDKDVTAERLEPTVSKALKAKGYYDARISILDNEKEESFSIVLGEQYTISQINVDSNKYYNNLSLNTGDILDAGKVLLAQQEVYDYINENFCFYNLDIEHAVILNKDKKTADIEFTTHGEDDAVFGNTVINGADAIDRDYLYNFIEYEEGDCWKQQKLEDTKAALYATGLLASAKAVLPETLPNDGIIPVSLDVKSRAFRSIKLGAGYNTNDGAGVSAEWEHRNFLGAGERLSIKTRLYQIIQTVGGTFKKPFFFRDDQSLLLETALKQENNESYKELSYNVSGSVVRQLNDDTSISLGTAYELSRIEDEGEAKNYGLFSIPGVLNFDNRDNILDPHEGWNLQLNVTPFFDTLGEADPFVKSRFTASTYFDLLDSNYDPVLALKGSIGTIQGASAENIPASKRFYAGGGGSVRGFGYQEIGPRDSDDDPSGGLSIMELTGEMRFKVSEKIGAVGFVDAGQVYESASPNFGTDLAIGAGVGARYYTSFGPVRFDVATPINRKEITDSSYQIYLSIGQAF